MRTKEKEKKQKMKTIESNHYLFIIRTGRVERSQSVSQRVEWNRL